MSIDNASVTGEPYYVMNRNGTLVRESDNSKPLKVNLIQVNSLFTGGAGNVNNVKTTDPVGNGVNVGDLWINSATNKVWFWDGATWQLLIGA